MCIIIIIIYFYNIEKIHNLVLLEFCVDNKKDNKHDDKIVYSKVTLYFL